MNKYIKLLKNLILFENEFDDEIKNILYKIFNDYYLNRSKYLYNIDNLYKKYDKEKYELIKNKYLIKNNKNNTLIFQFNRYNRKYYIKRLLNEKGIDNNELLEDILKNDKITNYKDYIDDLELMKILFKLN